MEPSTNIKMIFRDNGQSLQLCYGILSVEKRQWEWLLHKSSFQHYHGVKVALQTIEKRLLIDLQNLHEIARCGEDSNILPEPKLLLTQREVCYWKGRIKEIPQTEESLQLNILPTEKIEFYNTLSGSQIYLQTRQPAIMLASDTERKGRDFGEALTELMDQLSVCLSLYAIKDFKAFEENCQSLVEISGALLKGCLAFTHHFVPVLATVNDRKTVAQAILEREANFFLGFMDMEKTFDLTDSYLQWKKKYLLRESEQK